MMCRGLDGTWWRLREWEGKGGSGVQRTGWACGDDAVGGWGNGRGGAQTPSGPTVATSAMY